MSQPNSKEPDIPQANLPIGRAGIAGRNDSCLVLIIICSRLLGTFL